MTLERANQLFRQGDFAGARKILQRLLKSGQQAAPAWRLLGYIEGQTGGLAAAVDCFKSSLRYDATSAETWYYLGFAHQKMEAHDAAVEAYDRTLKLAPGLFEASHNLGVSLIALGRNEEALPHLAKAAALNPQSFEAHLNHGVALGKLRRYEAEIAAYEKALSLDRSNRTLVEDYGIALCQLGRFSQAVAHYEDALARHPEFDFARGGLLFAKANAGDWSGFEEAAARLQADIAQDKDCINPFELVVLPSTAAQQLRVARRYSQQHFPVSSTPLHDAKRAPGDRLRIAYLSADFHAHATAFLVTEVLERHDRTRFDTIGLSTGKDDGSTERGRLEKAFGQFIDVSRKSDRDIARLVADMNVDILVDLKGYTTEARPAVMAMRPAPIQISYLGFPGTMGAEFIDYLVADRFLIPDADRQFYSEKIIYLPDSYQPNDATREIGAEPLARADLGLPVDAFVFCNFNSSYKITPEFFDIWMRLLSGMRNSVLWLMARSGEYEANLRKEAAKRGISPERLIFAPQVDARTHLRRLQLADLFLDNLPCNAHTTASDALWAGLPLLTCVGGTFAGRVAGSLLTAAGLPELISTSVEDYEYRALDLVGNHEKLKHIRHKLETAGRSSALFDAERYVRHLESGYTAASARHRAGERPDHILVASSTPAPA